uniref:U-box domain containing 5 n=1 Tax=Knipowitschia caucasica TaxID=637954 RepID=A0AAV2MR45_KNICA
MVVNLCLPQFLTSVQCNKLCADGYDVTNLISSDPAIRRRGFKLEYFLCPPLQVTLTFDFKVDLCRVDVELWPWGMDRGQASVNCRHEELWSRGGMQSLAAVTQLRVVLPFGGAASALGLKALSVWGQPARCCSAEVVERVQKVYEARERPTQAPVSVTSVCPPKIQKRSPTCQSFQVPEEFLDPITQEIMILPMLLPGGVAVDQSTLEEYQKREATWGRAPNDPFTGVPFTASSKPLPHPQLKSRIDHFLLQRGDLCKDGRLGRKDDSKNPLPSRLVAVEKDKRSSNAGGKEIQRFHCERVGKQDLNKSPKHKLEDREEARPPQEKRQRNEEAACSSHEQRMSASLDEALSSALQGRPSFTSNLCLNAQLDTKTLHQSQRRMTESSLHKDEKNCSACSSSISVYSKPDSLIYRLACGHFLCRSCLQRPAPNPTRTSTCSNVLCPTCHSSTPRSDIIRVHH